METQEATPDSLVGESCALELPSVCDLRGSRTVQTPSQESSPEPLSSVELCSFPCSPAIPDGPDLKTVQKDPWNPKNCWADLSVKGQSETEEEDGRLRESLDRFYEAFTFPPPVPGDSLPARVCQCLSQKINELRDRDSQQYALRSFQMARVIFSRDGCSVLRRHSRHTHFYPLGEESSSVDDEKPIPGLSREILRFLRQRAVMEDS